jgi:hypothetical protein
MNDALDVRQAIVPMWFSRLQYQFYPNQQSKPLISSLQFFYHSFGASVLSACRRIFLFHS